MPRNIIELLGGGETTAPMTKATSQTADSPKIRYVNFLVDIDSKMEPRSETGIL